MVSTNALSGKTTLWMRQSDGWFLNAEGRIGTSNPRQNSKSFGWSFSALLALEEFALSTPPPRRSLRPSPAPVSDPGTSSLRVLVHSRALSRPAHPTVRPARRSAPALRPVLALSASQLLLTKFTK